MAGRSENKGNERVVHLQDRDYAMFRDIFEFYYIDYHTARLRYFYHLESERSARSSFNQRMATLRDAGYISPVPFFSDRRKHIRGHSDYAYTLTAKGFQMLHAYWDIEPEWDPSLKNRSALFVIHHLNTYYFACLFRRQLEEGVLADYVGEQSGRFQEPNKEQIKKDFLKPDAILFWKYGRHVLPWLVEYERSSRQSKAVVNKKLQSHSDYAKKGLYLQHLIMKENDVTNPPVFLIYCEDVMVANFRLNRIAEEQFSFYDSKTAFGYSEILFGLQQEVEANPESAVFFRPSSERVSFDHVNFVQVFANEAMSRKISGLPADLAYQWIPTYLSTRMDLHLDGIINLSKGSFQASFLVRYYGHDKAHGEIIRELDHLQAMVAQDKLRAHPQLVRSFEAGNRPSLMVLVDTAEQEQQLLQLVAAREFEDGLSAVIISRRELIADDPYGANWLRHGQSERGLPI